MYVCVHTCVCACMFATLDLFFGAHAIDRIRFYIFYVYQKKTSKQPILLSIFI
jgi:hypothetical protein